MLIEINWIEHLDFKFFRINTGEKDFDIFVDIGKRYSHIKESFKR